MSIDVPFTKANLEYYLKELAKEYKKRGGGTPVEMILVGGASVLINYGFCAASYDTNLVLTKLKSRQNCLVSR